MAKKRPRRASRRLVTSSKRSKMNTPAPKPSEPSSRGGPAGKAGDDGQENPANVDKIRDILFGSQMRDYEKKFRRLEELQAKEAADLREEIKRGLAMLEAFVKRELGAMTDQLKHERSERAEADKEFTREFREHVKLWEKWGAQRDEQGAQGQRELRQQLLEEAKRLSEQMEQGQKGLAAALDQQAQEMRASLTDRLALADLFAEVSLRDRKSVV